MAELLDPSEVMFTAFEPKVANRFIMYIEGIPAYLIKAANRPSITCRQNNQFLIFSFIKKNINYYEAHYHS
jgi:hypothetical protein